MASRSQGNNAPQSWQLRCESHIVPSAVLTSHQYWSRFSAAEITSTRQAMYVQRSIRGAFVQALLQRKSKTYYAFWVCICSLRYPACNEHVTRPAIQYFSTLSHKLHDFRKKKRNVIEHKMCVTIFPTNSVW